MSRIPGIRGRRPRGWRQNCRLHQSIAVVTPLVPIGAPTGAPLWPRLPEVRLDQSQGLGQRGMS